MQEEIIGKIAKLIAADLTDESKVLHLLALCRKLMERISKSDQTKYRVLRFYCNWALHTEIDQSSTAASLLVDANNLIADHLKKKDNTSLQAELDAALSIEKVHDQVNTLLANVGMGADLITAAKWRLIKLQIVEIISHCPLKLGSGRQLNKFRQALLARPLKDKSVVEELTIIKVQRIVFDPKASEDEVTFCIQLKLSDSTRIMTPMIG